jgi:signal peptidase I
VASAGPPVSEFQPEPPLTKPKKSRASTAVEFAAVILAAVVVAYAVQAWFVKPYRIPSASMEPTLAVGERILTDRIGLHFGSPKVGDIMVFHPPADYSDCAAPPQGQPRQVAGQACDVVGRAESSTTFVKRVVGLPGDHLQIIDGHVIDNGRRESDAYAVACPDPADCTFARTIVVPKGDYYMMGDNRPDSEDSRFWGPVPRSWLIGYVFLSYWPFNHIRVL